MRFPLVIRAAAFAVALLVGTTSTRADEREDRDRKARAALALTAPPKKLTTAAPKPREVGAEYATAYARAVEQSKPLVVYVGCKADHKAPGAVPAKADALPGVTGPAAVVMYPRGDGLLVHRVMQCPVDDAELSKAIKDATKKANGDMGKSADKPAPKPLDWQIRADFERPDARTELDYAMDSAARIRSGDSWGSGTVVYAEPGRSVILTANHILKPGEPVEVRAAGRNLAGRVILTDSAADLAAVEVARELPHVAVVDDDLAEGDDVLLIGAASVWSRGQCSGHTRYNDRAVAVLTYDSYSGDSGGGVFRRGLLVGVHTGGHRGAKNAARGLVPFVARAVRGEPAPAAKAAPVASAAPTCPTGNCPLKSPFAAPVTLPAGGCANGQCDLPNYNRGIFRRR